MTGVAPIDTVPPAVSRRPPPMDEPRAVMRRAVLEALGVPALSLLFSMIGFGSVMRASDLSLGMAVATTMGVWGLPGQLAMVEAYAAGGGVLAAALACSFANARFMPMAVSFMPLMREGLSDRRWMYLLVQMLSLNPWAVGQRVFPQIAPRLRWLWFACFAGVCVAAGTLGTTLGWLGVGALPLSVALGLVFLNPLYFAVVMAGVSDRPSVVAMLAGAVTGPLMHLVSPDWGLIMTGALAGSAAWLATRRRRGPLA